MGVLRNQVKSLEDIPEALHEYYVKGKDSDGNEVFLLQTEEAQGLKSALARERQRADKASKTLTEFEEAGITVEMVQNLQGELDVLKSEGAEKQKEALDALREQLVQQHKEALKQKDTAIQKRDSALRGALLSDRARAAIVSEGGDPVVLSPHVERHLEVVEEDDGFHVQVIGTDGQVRVDGNGAPLSIEAVVRSLKDDDHFAPNFESRKTQGVDVHPTKTKTGVSQVLQGDPVARLRAHRRQQARK